MAYLNVANYNTNSGFNYVNVCNNVNDYAGFGKECLGSSTYMARMIGVQTTHNGNTENWVSFFHTQNDSNPITWTATAITNFNSTFEGVSLNPPADMRSPIVLFPFTQNTTASYNNYYSVVPDFSNPTYVAWSDWSNWSASKVNRYITVIPVVEAADDPIPDSGSTDMSGIVNAILMIPAVLIVLGVFTMIYRMFINRRVRG